MDVTLTQEQTDWLDARVASGEFASLGDAVRQLLDEAMAEARLGEDDLDWAKPYIDEALEAVARGEVIPVDVHRARTAAFLPKLRDR